MPMRTVVSLAGRVAGLSVTAVALAQTTLTFRDGLGDYDGTLDTFISAQEPDTAYPNSSGDNNSVDADLSSAVEGRLGSQTLLRFDGLFGDAPDQIPAGSAITSATLTIQVLNGSTDTSLSLHLLTVPWDNTATWNSLSGGIDFASDALAQAAAILDAPVGTGARTLDVTTSLASWASGTANYGWAFLPLAPGGENDNTDGINFRRSESGTVSERPTLQVTFVAVPEPATRAILGLGFVALVASRRMRKP